MMSYELATKLMARIDCPVCFDVDTTNPRLQEGECVTLHINAVRYDKEKKCIILSNY